MAAESRVSIVLEAQDRASAALRKAEGVVTDFGKAAKKTESSLSSFAKAAAASAAVWKVFDFVRSSVQSFADAQVAQTRLTHILKTATDATDANIASLIAQAEALQKVGVVSDDVIMSAQGTLATFDLQASSIEKLTPAFLDMVVAERGVNATTQDMIGLANGLGKVLQGQTGALAQQGFVFSEAQKQMLEHGTETEKVTALTEILGSTYQGLNKTMAETFEGRMARARNMIDDFKEKLGGALSPTILQITEGLSGMADQTANGSSALEFIGKVAYSTTALFQALYHSVVGVSTVIGGSLASAGKLAGYAKEQLTTSFAKGIDAITGGWGIDDETMTQLEIQAGEAAGIFEDEALVVGEAAQVAFDKMEAAWDKAANLKGFSVAAASFGKVGGGAADAAEEMEKTKEAIDKLGSAYEDFSRDADDTLFDLKQRHKETMASIRKEMEETQRKINELPAEYADRQKSNTQRVAEAVVANEERVAEIQKELAGDVAGSKRKELKDELASRLAAIQENEAFVASIQSQVDEARRVAGLSDLERSIEEFNQRKAMDDAELAGRIAGLQAEMSALKKQKDDEKELYKERRDFIGKMLKDAEERHAAALANQNSATKKYVEKEIAYYRELASAIDAARSGNTAAINRAATNVKKVNDAVISPNGNIISTHPDDYIIATKKPGELGGGGVSVSVDLRNATVSADAVGEKIGDAIIKKLQLTMRV